MNEGSEVRGEYFYLRGLILPRKYLLPDAATEARIRKRERLVNNLILPIYFIPFVLSLLHVKLGEIGLFLSVAVPGITFAMILERALLNPLLEPYRPQSTRATRQEQMLDRARRNGWGSLYFLIIMALFIGILTLGTAATEENILFWILGGSFMVGLAVWAIRVAMLKHRDETARDTAEVHPPTQAKA